MLDKIVKFSLDQSNTIDQIIRECTEAICTTIEIERSSVWFYNEEKNELIASDIFLKKSIEHLNGAILKAENFPEYFTAISSKRAIVADDARTDPRTAEFNESYLQPQNIFSMLDAPIRSGAGLCGVVCCETVGTVKQWSEDEIAFVGSVADIIALAVEGNRLREAQEHIFRLAHYDGLTNLGNRTSFNQHISLAFENAVNNDIQLHLYLIDLDRFKPVNDQYGHEIGDQILASVGNRLSKLSSKTVDCQAFRLGGDEFACLVSGINEADAKHFGQKLTRYISRTYTIQHKQIQIGASVGCASIPGLVTSQDELIKAADLAMYSIKRNKSSAFAFFDKNLESSALRKKLLEKDLVTAVEKKDFSLFLQPIINAADGNISGGEVLLRWFNERLGDFVSPETFIPIAEANGLIAQIDHFVLSEALSLIDEWDKRGIYLPFVSVNISPETLMRKNLLNELDMILSETSTPLDRIKLEVTEGVEMLNELEMSKIFSDIRSRGLKIYIDDFGSGHTGLSYFTSIPVDGIKIDRSLTSNLLTCEKSNIVITSIVQLAKAMDLEIVIEGIETKQQYEAVKAYGAIALQGYYFSHPIPIDDFEKFLEKTSHENRKHVA